MCDNNSFGVREGSEAELSLLYRDGLPSLRYIRYESISFVRYWREWLIWKFLTSF